MILICFFLPKFPISSFYWRIMASSLPRTWQFTKNGGHLQIHMPCPFEENAKVLLPRYPTWHKRWRSYGPPWRLKIEVIQLEVQQVAFSFSDPYSFSHFLSSRQSRRAGILPWCGCFQTDVKNRRFTSLPFPALTNLHQWKMNKWTQSLTRCQGDQPRSPRILTSGPWHLVWPHLCAVSRC